METLRIIIIGASGYIPTDTTKAVKKTSLPLDVLEATNLCSNSNYKLLVYLVDENMYKYTLTKEDKAILKQYPQNVGRYPLKYQDIFHSRSARVVEKEHSLIFDPFRSTEDHIIYINIVSDDDIYEKVLNRAKSPYDLASMVHTETYKNKYFMCQPVGRFSLLDIVTNFFQGQLLELYNPVSGDLNPNTNDQAVTRILNTGISHLIWYLKAGYDEYKNNLQVPGWVLQCSSCWNQNIIDYYLITPGIPEFQGGSNNIGLIDHDIQIYMNDYSGFRKAITECTLSVLSNYVIKNNIITLDNVKLLGGWKSIKLWESLENKL
jgi:hypothetical protein